MTDPRREAVAQIVRRHVRFNTVMDVESFIDDFARLFDVEMTKQREEWMLYVGQPGDPTYEALVAENIRLAAETRALREANDRMRNGLTAIIAHLKDDPSAKGIAISETCRALLTPTLPSADAQAGEER